MITIGMVPRERFSVAPQAVARLFAVTPGPFRFVIVDCATPYPYWSSIKRVLDGRDNVIVIRRDAYLLPNHSRNLVVEASQDSEWVCLLDNDVLVSDGWLQQLLGACEQEHAQVAVPLITEGSEQGPVHFDRRLGCIRSTADSTARGVEFAREIDYSADLSASRRWQDCLEDHCVLYRRTLLNRIGSFDATLNTREPVDLAMRIRTAGARVLFEPRARVVFLPPPPIAPDDRDFFSFRWDGERAVASTERIVSRWNIVNLPRSHAFVTKRRRMLLQ